MGLCCNTWIRRQENEAFRIYGNRKCIIHNIDLCGSDVHYEQSQTWKTNVAISYIKEDTMNPCQVIQTEFNTMVSRFDSTCIEIQ